MNITLANKNIKRNWTISYGDMRGPTNWPEMTLLLTTMSSVNWTFAIFMNNKYVANNWVYCNIYYIKLQLILNSVFVKNVVVAQLF